MTDFSLFDAGWRQGSLFEAVLSISAIVVSSETGTSESSSWQHHVWTVVTQDCDLSGFSVTSNEPSVELRPVYRDDPPGDWGIRARRILLTDDSFLISESPRLAISPAALVQCRAGLLPALNDGRLAALKTWLGLRYDRPAVPPQLVDLMRAIAKAFNRPRGPLQQKIHDILVEVEEAENPIFGVFVVTVDDVDSEEVRAWASGRLADVPGELGILAGLEIGTRAETSLELLENSYSADLSQITWGKQSGPLEVH
ncbi:hypothetical protein [Streptomyces niveus]|uniref:hypothetical protein n=1 Tax=Streptomyces niveus TaxID=193462 RepID=UPI0035D980B9